MNRYPMYSSLIENEEGRRVSGQFQLEKDVPEQVNAHAATLWECSLLLSHYDGNVAKAVKEFGQRRKLAKEESWREALKKDFSHRIFSIKRVTKAKEPMRGKHGENGEEGEEEDEQDEEEAIDELLDDAFGTDSEHEEK